MDRARLSLGFSRSSFCLREIIDQQIAQPLCARKRHYQPTDNNAVDRPRRHFMIHPSRFKCEVNVARKRSYAGYLQCKNLGSVRIVDEVYRGHLVNHV
jgi:hypothetical protein